MNQSTNYFSTFAITRENGTIQSNAQGGHSLIFKHKLYLLIINFKPIMLEILINKVNIPFVEISDPRNNNIRCVYYIFLHRPDYLFILVCKN